MWTDRETDEDCLGFGSYVKVLADICVERSIAPLTLGVFGSWGSGKSSLMKMLQQHVESTVDSHKFKTLWFNAWRYEGKEEAQVALIHSILNKFQENRTLSDDAKNVLKRLKDGASVIKLAKFIGKSAMTLTPDLAGLLDCFRDESEKLAATMESFEKDFEEFLKMLEVEGIVVFIDDLDRCQSSKVVEIFETIKLFLNTPKCTFVIGADPDKIEHAIGDTYRVVDLKRTDFTKDYLEKIIQLPFRIPEQQLSDIACYVGMLVMKRFVTDEAWQTLLQERVSLIGKGEKIGDAFNEWVIQHPTGMMDKKVDAPLKQLQRTLPYVSILAHGLKGNPRQIKRFLNIVGMRERLAEHNKLSVDSDVLIKLAVLEYAWPEFFGQLVETFDPSSGVSTLVVEVLKAHREQTKEPDSPWVRVALESPGLADFLAADPCLDEGFHLGPYLFLAQTSLVSQKGGGVTTLEQLAKSFATRISSEDRVRADAAARQAAKAEPAVVAAVVRLLTPKLFTPDGGKVQTHVLTGLATICREHPKHYEEVLAAIEQLPSRPRSAVSFVAATIIQSAEKVGAKLSDGLKERFVSASPIAQSLVKRGAKERK